MTDCEHHFGDLCLYCLSFWGKQRWYCVRSFDCAIDLCQSNCNYPITVCCIIMRIMIYLIREYPPPTAWTLVVLALFFLKLPYRQFLLTIPHARLLKRCQTIADVIGFWHIFFTLVNLFLITVRAHAMNQE